MLPKIQYINKNFRPASRKIIDQANVIIDEYMDDDLRLTLRQLYYQFVARGLMPNIQKEYKKLVSLVGDARLAGLIDWTAIEDRSRNLNENTHWRDPGHILSRVRSNFMLDHWVGQEYCVEVWVEKEALLGIIGSICEDLDVAYFACKGYVSLSEMWVASQRLIYHDEDAKPIIIHLGDHDPSGIDMTRDIQDRQDVFRNWGLEVSRIALNMNQVQEYNPPPNPVKEADTRHGSYVSLYGEESWELDALEPRVLRQLIQDTVEQYRDDSIYQEVLTQEREYLEILARVEENWEEL